MALHQIGYVPLRINVSAGGNHLARPNALCPPQHRRMSSQICMLTLETEVNRNCGNMSSCPVNMLVQNVMDVFMSSVTGKEVDNNQTPDVEPSGFSCKSGHVERSSSAVSTLCTW